jgi:hypothetical protein
VAVRLEERTVRVSPLLWSVATFLVLAGPIQARSADIDPDACFCLKDASGRLQRGCRALKFPNQADPIAQCRDPKSGHLSAPIPITGSWTVVMEGEAGCEVCWPQSRETDGEGRGDGGAARVIASRLFAGPSQYPPEEFAAYGILAFRSRASSQDRARHLMICESYASTLPHADELAYPRSEQMVTVWPIDSDASASQLNEMPRDAVCDTAIKHYGLVTALGALKDAELAGVGILGIGPFLLAWSPSTDKGQEDALVLVSDLSHVTTYEQAQQIMLGWSRDIEQNPQLWTNGWDVEKLLEATRLWVDKYGPKILVLFGAKE